MICHNKKVDQIILLIEYQDLTPKFFNFTKEFENYKVKILIDNFKLKGQTNFFAKLELWDIFLRFYHFFIYPYR